MARSCSIWTPVLFSLSPMNGESAKISRRRVILATSVGSPQEFSCDSCKESLNSAVEILRWSDRFIISLIASVVFTLSLEANIKEHQKLQVLDSKDVSRRNTMIYLAAGVLGGINILHGETAEARVGRKENRRKALEKLRGKAKESEPKSGDKKKEKELDTELFPLLPAPLQQQALGPVVEANLLQ